MAGLMITKVLFLVKEIHRIGTRDLRDKKGLLETSARYPTFFALRASRRGGLRGNSPSPLARVLHHGPDRRPHRCTP